MTEGTKNTDRATRETTWQRRTAAFRAALEESFRSHRLVPWLAQRAGRAEPVTHPLGSFSSRDFLPTTEFSLEQGSGLIGMAGPWGENIAAGETQVFIAELGRACVIQPADKDLAGALYGALGRTAGGSPETTVILAPARTALVRELHIDPPGDLEWLPGMGARASVRGLFEGVPYIAARPFEATELWVVDFRRIGTWQYAGALDELITHADLLRDRFVRVGDTRDFATQITADAYSRFVLEQPSAARGIRIGAED